MRHPLRLALCLMLGAGAARAEPLDTAEAFERQVTGRTIFFDFGNNAAPASETYFPGRRTLWSPGSGEACQEGEWYAQSGLICFVYDINPTPQCWAVERGATGLTARLADDTAPLTIVEVAPKGQEQVCPGPRIGV